MTEQTDAQSDQPDQPDQPAAEPEIGDGQYGVGDGDRGAGASGDAEAPLTTDPEAQVDDSVVNPESS